MIKRKSPLEAPSTLNNVFPKERRPSDEKIPKTIWQIGIMMCLLNISFVMAYSFSGLYLKNIIGASAMSIGILEGGCEISSHLMKLFSGMLSDFFGKRKGVMVCGYTLSILSRPILAIFSSFGAVLSGRMMERLGNGIQATPRDAMVADIAPKNRIGECYGLKRSLAYIGSLLGGVFAILAIKATNNNYQMVFAIASLPGIFALIILIFCVKEPKRPDALTITSVPSQLTPKAKFSFKNFKCMGSTFWILMIINAIFMIAKMNETFLILRMNEFKSDPMFAPTVMIVFNLGTMLASYPVGVLGDKIRRVNLLCIGISFLILADIIMYSVPSISALYFGVLFWGIQFGAVQNVFISLIVENIPENLRGTGIGIYWLTNAFAGFWADTLAGFVAHYYSLKHIFVSSGTIGLIALLVLFLMMRLTPFKRKAMPE
jgi:predicted MFS family arabinose efflux permease